MFGSGGLLEPHDISLPQLPAELVGLRVAHVSDLHVARRRRRHVRLLSDLARSGVDLIVLTGDYMHRYGDEPAALDMLDRLCETVRPRCGLFGVFGNHDSAKLKRAVGHLPVRWLSDEAAVLDGLPLQIVGLEFLDFGRTRPDTVHAAASCRGSGSSAAFAGLRLMLCHYSEWLPTAADMGVNLMFSGHTHGGQCRLPGCRALKNCTSLPLHLTCGMLRHLDTVCIVSRGLGETRLPLRLFCPPHVPVVTLRRGPLPGLHTNEIVNVRRW